MNNSLDVRAGGGRGGRGATSYEYADEDDDDEGEDEAEGGAPHEEDGTPCVYFPFLSRMGKAGTAIPAQMKHGCITPKHGKYQYRATSCPNDGI